MGIFSSLGRKTERVKQAVTSTTSYRCQSCDEKLSEEFEHCPNCGSDAVVAVE